MQNLNIAKEFVQILQLPFESVVKMISLTENEKQALLSCIYNIHMGVFTDICLYISIPITKLDFELKKLIEKKV